MVRRLSHLFLPFAWALLALCLCPLTAAPQAITATISGTVRDPAGAALSEVTITVKNLETGLSRTAMTDNEGRYHVTQLSLGNYEVRAEREGFKTDVRTGIKLTVGREAIVDFTMQVGQITEQITVTGEAPLVESRTATIAWLVDDLKIRDLPLNGRSIDQLVLLQPGVNVMVTASRNFFAGRSVKISAGGARQDTNLFLLDGTDINDARNRTPGSVASTLLGVETIREFKVLTNAYTAEVGKISGTVVNAVTKSGTNELHGSALAFHRNSALDARNFFDLRKPPFIRNQFGWTLGGPIVQNRSFFFGAYEGLRERLGVTQVAIVPDDNARRGLVPDPQNPGQLKNVGVAPAIRPYLDLFPRANGRNFGNGTAEWLGSTPQPIREDFFQIRLDHLLSASTPFFARYTFDDAEANRPMVDLPLIAMAERSRNQYLTVQFDHTLSPSLLNSFRFGFNRSFSSSENVPLVNIPPELGFLPGKSFFRSGGIIIPGATSPLTGFILNPVEFILNLYEWSDDLSYTRGAHALKAGVLIKDVRFNTLFSFNDSGVYVFPSSPVCSAPPLECFLTNRPTLFLGPLPGSDNDRSIRNAILGFYVQDDYQIRPRVMLNLGLRYEFSTRAKEIFGEATNTYDPLGAAVTGKFFLKENISLRSFAPRLGFAWDLLGTGKTTLRGGFGIFFHQIAPFDLYGPVGGGAPIRKLATITAPPFPNIVPTLEEAARRGVPLINFPAPMTNTPYLMRWSLDIQREFLPDTVFTIGYVGSRGVHLIRVFNGNEAIPDVLPDGTKFWPAGRPRRNPRFGASRWTVTDANSFYHGMILSVNRRFSRGLQLQASYTVQKSVDDASTVFASDSRGDNVVSIDPDFRHLNRGLSSFDMRQVFVFNFTYDLPGKNLEGAVGKLLGGWQINGITTLQSGFPFTVELAFNRSRNGGAPGVFSDLSERPNLRSGFSNNPVLGGPDQYFDRRAFELQPAGFLGNLGRDTLIGPGLANVDFSLVKTTAVREDLQIQFRTEFFNLFNRANFDIPIRTIPGFGPDGVPTGPIGRITATTTTSRQVQFGLKVLF